MRVGSRTTRWLLLVSAVLIASGLVHLVVFALDDRPWAGPVSWRKPFTFGISFGITLAAVTWLAGRLHLPERTRTILLTVFAADCVVEVAGITLQAWRGVPSHLNRSTPFDSAVATVLAAGGAVLIVVLGRMAIPALRGRVDATPSMRTALRSGFALLVAGLLAGAAMIAAGVITERGGSSSAEVYARTGFIKDFHGVTLHAVLVLPVLAALLGRLDWTEARRVAVVRVAATAYVVVAVAVLALDLAKA